MIGRLLNHYWTANEPEELRRAQIEDWIEDLAEFGPDIVAFGVGEWRQTQTRRPTPADIRLLCIAEMQHQAERVCVPAIEDMRAIRHSTQRSREHQDAEMVAEGKRIGNEWAQQRGFPDLDSYAAAEGLDYVDARVRVVQSICAASPFTARVGSFRSLASLVGGGAGVQLPLRPPQPSLAASLGVTAEEIDPGVHARLREIGAA